MWLWSLGQKDPLAKGMATHSSILAWRIPWTEEPGRLQSMGSQRAGHDWSDLAWTHARTGRLSAKNITNAHIHPSASQKRDTGVSSWEREREKERERGSLTKCSYLGAKRLPAPPAAQACEEALAAAATAGWQGVLCLRRSAKFNDANCTADS